QAVCVFIEFAQARSIYPAMPLHAMGDAELFSLALQFGSKRPITHDRQSQSPAAQTSSLEMTESLQRQAKPFLRREAAHEDKAKSAARRTLLAWHEHFGIDAVWNYLHRTSIGLLRELCQRSGIRNNGVCLAEAPATNRSQ